MRQRGCTEQPECPLSPQHPGGQSGAGNAQGWALDMEGAIAQSATGWGRGGAPPLAHVCTGSILHPRFHRSGLPGARGS